MTVTPTPCPPFELVVSGKALSCGLPPGHPGRLCAFVVSKRRDS